MNIEKLVIYALRDTDCPIYDKITRPDGLTFVIATLKQTEPRAPYLLFNVVSHRKIGLPYKSIIHNKDNIKEHIFQVKEYTLSLTLHAEKDDPAQEWFRHFENGIHSDLIDWAFTNQGLSLVSATDILHQFQPISGVPYKRAIIDLTLRVEVEEDYKVFSVDRVNITGSTSTTEGVDSGNIVIDKQAK